jgi:hypothetical protein
VLGEGGAQGGDVLRDGVRADVGDGAVAGRQHRGGRPARSAAGGELREVLVRERGRAGRGDGAGEPGEPGADVGDVADLAGLAVVDHVEAGLDLPRDALRHRRGHHVGIELGATPLPVGERPEQRCRAGQTAGVGGADRALVHDDSPPHVRLHRAAVGAVAPGGRTG